MVIDIGFIQRVEPSETVSVEETTQYNESDQVKSDSKGGKLKLNVLTAFFNENLPNTMKPGFGKFML